jgi:6-phosphogluconolactonase (cycloisomerase 2 family)
MNKINFGMVGLVLVVLASGCGGSDSSGSATPTPAPTATPVPTATPAPTPTPTPVFAAQFAYVLNRYGHSVSQYRVGAGGQLVAQSPASVATGFLPRAMTMDATENFLYVVDQVESAISQFTINANGSLSTLAPPVTAGTLPESIVRSPDGKFIYTANFSDSTLSQFSVAGNGQLTFVSAIPTGEVPVNLVFSPSGGFAYLLNLFDSLISQFSYSASGSFTALTPPTVSASGCPTGPMTVTQTTAGKSYLFLLSCFTSTVEVFTINADGTLAATFKTRTGSSPQGMAVLGSTLYVANAYDASSSVFAIQADGSLLETGFSPISAGILPETLAIDAVGMMAYVVDYAANEILQFNITTNGDLLPVAAGTVSTEEVPIQIILK